MHSDEERETINRWRSRLGASLEARTLGGTVVDQWTASTSHWYTW